VDKSATGSVNFFLFDWRGSTGVALRHGKSVNGHGRALDVSAASGQGAEKSGHP
jgi:hypothetical protein